MLLCSAFAMLPAQAAAPSDAPPKHRLCEPCALPLLPVALPRKGLIFNYESVMSSVSLWYVADLERGEAIRMHTKGNSERGPLTVVDQTRRAIPAHELTRLKQIDKEIWALEDRLPAHFAAEVGWHLWLLDGGDVRHELQAGIPNGPSKEIDLMMQRVLARPAPSE